MSLPPDNATPSLFAARAFAAIPKLLTLQDRNPHSPTYGCFDRNYWQYKIIDFPSGMAQEFVWPLALAWALPHPANPFSGEAAVRDWVVAGLRYMRSSSHADGSCDDYYPHERAVGATAFALLAGLEAYDLLGLEDDELLAFFERRAAWLAGRRESGRLSNHEALVVTCLVRLAAVTGRDRWRGDVDARLERLLSWQTPEGWFWEYEGCDPGYLTLTISLLARLDMLLPEAGLREPLRRAIAFASEFIHPDGSYGGEYGSRNTLNFFPHGFELAGSWMPGATAVNDLYLQGVADGRAPCFEDDHIIGHHLWNYLLAWRDAVPARNGLLERGDGTRHFPLAGLLVDRRAGAELYLALNKGGVFKCFRDGRLAAADTQISIETSDGVAVGHLVDDYLIELGEDTITISGRLGWAKASLMTPMKLLILRLVMLTVGRLFSDAVRRLLQHLLITGKRPAPFSFRRHLDWRDGAWEVEDRVEAADWSRVRSARIDGHQTSIHVVMSRVFQAGQLLPGRDLTRDIRGLSPGEPLVARRRIE